MPRSYPLEQKLAALIMLDRNYGNVALTAQQTGIAENTIYAWQRSIRPFFQQSPLPPQHPAELPAFEDDLEMLTFIRRQILDEMLRLSVDLKNSSGISTPYQRVLVLSQLMDKLMKLDTHLRPYQPADEDIEYVLTDDVEEQDDDIIEIAYYKPGSGDDVRFHSWLRDNPDRPYEEYFTPRGMPVPEHLLRSEWDDSSDPYQGYSNRHNDEADLS